MFAAAAVNSRLDDRGKRQTQAFALGGGGGGAALAALNLDEGVQKGSHHGLMRQRTDAALVDDLDMLPFSRLMEIFLVLLQIHEVRLCAQLIDHLMSSKLGCTRLGFDKDQLKETVYDFIHREECRDSDSLQLLRSVAAVESSIKDSVELQETISSLTSFSHCSAPRSSTAHHHHNHHHQKTRKTQKPRKTHVQLDEKKSRNSEAENNLDQYDASDGNIKVKRHSKKKNTANKTTIIMNQDDLAGGVPDENRQSHRQSTASKSSKRAIKDNRDELGGNPKGNGPTQFAEVDSLEIAPNEPAKASDARNTRSQAPDDDDNICRVPPGQKKSFWGPNWGMRKSKENDYHAAAAVGGGSVPMKKHAEYGGLKSAFAKGMGIFRSSVGSKDPGKTDSKKLAKFKNDVVQGFEKESQKQDRKSEKQDGSNRRSERKSKQDRKSEKSNPARISGIDEKPTHAIGSGANGHKVVPVQSTECTESPEKSLADPPKQTSTEKQVPESKYRVSDGASLVVAEDLGDDSEAIPPLLQAALEDSSQKPSENFFGMVEGSQTIVDLDDDNDVVDLDDDNDDDDDEGIEEESAGEDSFASDSTQSNEVYYEAVKTEFNHSKESAQLGLHLAFNEKNAAELARPTHRWMLHPNQTFRMGWNFISLLIIVAEAVTIPLWISFDVESLPLWHYFVIAFFSTDAIMSCVTGYYYGPLLVMRQSLILKRYLKSYFLIDFACTFPWEIVMEEEEGLAFKLMRSVRVFRLVRIFKLKPILKTLEDLCPFLGNSLALIKVLSVLAMLLHWSSCLWGFIGNPDKMNTPHAGLPPHDISDCTPGGPCEPGVHGSPWMRRYRVDALSIVDKYVASLHFATGILTGTDWGLDPGRNIERVYAIVMMVFSFLFCSVIISQIVVVVHNINADTNEFQEVIRVMREFMMTRKVPLTLQGKILRYLEFQHKTRKERSNDRMYVINMLSPWLKLELSHHLNSKVISHHPFFQQMPERVFKRACSAAETVLFAPGDVVVQRGNRASCMCFIVQGELRILRPKDTPHGSTKSSRDDDCGDYNSQPMQQSVESEKDPHDVAKQQTQFVGTTLCAPAWIGDACLFKDNMVRTSTVVAMTHTELLVVTKSSLNDLLDEFPQLVTIYKSWIQKAGDHGITCTHCGGFGHAVTECPKLKAELESAMAETYAESSVATNSVTKAPSVAPTASTGSKSKKKQRSTAPMEII